jgi:hypothetical protein
MNNFNPYPPHPGPLPQGEREFPFSHYVKDLRIPFALFIIKRDFHVAGTHYSFIR